MLRLRSWEDMPERMKNDAVRPYYELLRKKRGAIFAKRIFDVSAASVLLVLLSPAFLTIAVVIKLDSPGEVFFRQVRVSAYDEDFLIYKFRTMVKNAEALGSQLTAKADSRITKSGSFLRKCRLDELPQLLNILRGEMSFVGARPEVRRYVDCYTDEMMASLLLPAGVTSLASIKYRDEDKLLGESPDPSEIYLSRILPEKMRYNLEYLKSFNFLSDIALMLKTVAAVLK